MKLQFPLSIIPNLAESRPTGRFSVACAPGERTFQRVKVPNPPGSGKDIAKAKGDRREAESEGRRRQSSGPTNRNLVRPQMRVRLHAELKLHSYTESFAVTRRVDGAKECVSTRGGLTDAFK